jgi:lysophospholipase L1-like esterase
MILIHLGTNDAASHVAPSATITAYDTLLGEMRASNPNMKIVVSTLIPIAPKVFGKSVSDGIETLNAMLRVWVKRNGLVLVENFFGFDAETMTTEGEHPNESGSVFMAGKFFPIVEGLLGA